MVEVFRGGSNAGYPFTSEVGILTAVISLAMPNLNSRVSDAPLEPAAQRSDYLDLLEQKFVAVFAAAVEVGATAVVLPDAGCGVYQNNPADVGWALGEVLRSRFQRCFHEIHLVGRTRFADAAEAAAGAGGRPGQH
eukprot:TRINITY_DN11524_c0_g1_i2.p1 TRINITY_DN11524_c0_g1~~TRINITY_DN11524_c0_g1_i2.p1  ORF type:complete len:136 (-),score=20.48 TRINITY_DN11524_c0_g1_i2:155-562(-)